MKKKDEVTLLELKVLVDIAMERDPWRQAGGSRTVSQAIGRLKRKGFLTTDVVDGELRYVLTEAARKIVPITPQTAR